MQQQLKRLRKTLTKEEFIEREFNKSKSVGSKSVVKSTLINFEEFCKKVYGMDSQIMLVELQKNQGDELYHFLQDFINFLAKKGLKGKTIRTYFSFLRTFLRTQGIKIYSEEVKGLIQFPTDIKEMPEPLTKNQIKILLDNSKEDRKALYLTLLSSGMRVSEALSLRKKDFDLSVNPVRIVIPGKNTKTKQTRETFISSEAKELVLRKVKEISDEDLVFGKSHYYKKVLDLEERIFANLRKRPFLKIREISENFRELNFGRRAAPSTPGQGLTSRPPARGWTAGAYIGIVKLFVQRGSVKFLRIFYVVFVTYVCHKLTKEYTFRNLK